MLIFHKSLNSCTEIIEKKLLNYPVSGFVCRNCGEYFSWVAPKKALVARYNGFRKIPCSKIPEIARMLNPPIYCKECSKRLGMR